MYLCPNPSPLCTMKIDYGLNEMSSINETRRLRGFPREKIAIKHERKNLIKYHIIKHSRFLYLFIKKSLSNFLFSLSLRIMKAEDSYCHVSLLPQFHIQLVYKPHCGTQIILLGLFVRHQVAGKKQF